MANIASRMTSGTSYAAELGRLLVACEPPDGMPRADSTSSCSTYIAARPLYAFWEVWCTPWSWYQSVLASWQFG